MRRFIFAIVLSACGSAPNGSPAEVPVPEAPPHVEVKVPDQDSVVLPRSAPTGTKLDSIPKAERAPLHVTSEEVDGCNGYTSYANGVVTITTYIPKDQWPEREAEVREMLPTVFTMAEESASRYIADDFEHGISTEHSSMPDTLPIMVSIFDNCRVSQPYVKLRYRVWKSGDGGFGTDRP